jgi:hypothetical protein
MQRLKPEMWLANDFRNERQCWRFPQANQDWQQLTSHRPHGHGQQNPLVAHIPLQMTG